MTLLEASRRKCDFLERWAPPNAHVVWGRAEEQEPDAYGLALAKALAPPPVAAELCLSLVRPGGAAILWVGPSAEPERVARVAERIAGELVDSPPGFLVLGKLGPTPEGFPRRVGIEPRHADQMLLFSRFSPMLSFGRPTAGGHVVLSFSAVRVRG